MTTLLCGLAKFASFDRLSYLFQAEQAVAGTGKGKDAPPAEGGETARLLPAGQDFSIPEYVSALLFFFKLASFFHFGQGVPVVGRFISEYINDDWNGQARWVTFENFGGHYLSLPQQPPCHLTQLSINIPGTGGVP